MLARARAFVGEDGDESDDSDRASESPPRRRARRVIGQGISSRLYPAQEPDDTAVGRSGVHSPAGDSPQTHRPLSLPALHIGPGGPEDTPGQDSGEQTGKVRGPRWREQAKGGKNLRLNVTRKFKALTAPVFDDIE